MPANQRNKYIKIFDTFLENHLFFATIPEFLQAQPQQCYGSPVVARTVAVDERSRLIQSQKSKGVPFKP